MIRTRERRTLIGCQGDTWRVTIKGSVQRQKLPTRRFRVDSSKAPVYELRSSTCSEAAPCTLHTSAPCPLHRSWLLPSPSAHDGAMLSLRARDSCTPLLSLTIAALLQRHWRAIGKRKPAQSYLCTFKSIRSGHFRSLNTRTLLGVNISLSCFTAQLLVLRCKFEAPPLLLCHAKYRYLFRSQRPSSFDFYAP